MTTNTERAEWAEKCLTVFTDITNQNLDIEPEDAASDLIANIMHWLRIRGFNPDLSVKCGQWHHDFEKQTPDDEETER